MKKACITGANGQIGSYLSDIILKDNYEVYGLRRPGSTETENTVTNNNFHIMYGDITDRQSIINFVNNVKPDIFINCAAQSNVNLSFGNLSAYTLQATGDSVEYCLAAIKEYSPTTRFVQLGSSEMFGQSPLPQNELTALDPRSPYAEAKVSGYKATIEYRKNGLFASNAICFNSESPRRAAAFVTKKITQGAVAIKLGLQDKLHLGNLSSMRDWSHASDTAEAIYKIATAEAPDDFVVASGVMHSVQEFVERVFDKLDLNWKEYVIIDPKFFRPIKENSYCGNISKIQSTLNWQQKYNFDSLISEMVEYELSLTKNK